MTELAFFAAGMVAAALGGLVTLGAFLVWLYRGEAGEQ